MNNTSLGLNMRTLRQQHHYTQSDISKLIHVQRQTYANYERGLRLPTIDMIKILSKHYGVSIERFLSDQSISQQPKQLKKIKKSAVTQSPEAASRNENSAGKDDFEQELLRQYYRLPLLKRRELLSILHFLMTDT